MLSHIFSFNPLIQFISFFVTYYLEDILFPIVSNFVLTYLAYMQFGFSLIRRNIIEFVAREEIVQICFEGNLLYIN